MARPAGPRFRALDTRRPRRVLVVDDVVTTGATLRAAAHALTASGWGDVTLAAVASTPTSRVGSSHRRPNVVIRPRDADRGTQRPTRDRTRSMAGL
ncbi:MAG: phosphoribosyltransferase family protein [Ilumatobacteraceae bacterium]